MAEEVEVVEPTEDEQYAEWLDQLEDDGEESPEVAEAEAQADEEDAKALKVALKTQKVVEDFVTEEKLKDVEEKFNAAASDEEKGLLAIYRRGDETPAQLKKLMQLVHTKIQEANKPSPEDEEKAEKLAADIANKRYGAGPINTSRPVAPEDEWEEGRKRVREGDIHTAFAMWNALPSNGEATASD